MSATTTATAAETTTAELAEILGRLADADLRYARKNGRHMIARTRHGNIEVYWDGSEYGVVGHITGKKAAVKAFIVASYVVTE